MVLRLVGVARQRSDSRSGRIVGAVTRAHGPLEDHGDSLGKPAGRLRTGRPRIGENGEDVAHSDQVDALGPEPGEDIRLQARPPLLLRAAAGLPLPGVQGDHLLGSFHEQRNTLASGDHGPALQRGGSRRTWPVLLPA